MTIFSGTHVALIDRWDDESMLTLKSLNRRGGKLEPYRGEHNSAAEDRLGLEY